MIVMVLGDVIQSLNDEFVKLCYGSEGVAIFEDDLC